MGVWTIDDSATTFPTYQAAQKAMSSRAERGLYVASGHPPRYRDQTIPRRPEYMPASFYRFALAGADHYSDPHEAHAYVDAREHGETPTLAHSRALAERVVRAVLSPSDVTNDGPYGTALDVYDVDIDALMHTTADPKLDALTGTAHDAVTGARILSPLDIPEGATVRVWVHADEDGDAHHEMLSGFVDAEALDAWRRDQWAYVGVVALVELPDGRSAFDAVWGVERGDYWPGSPEAQVWHVIPGLVREALSMTQYADPRPPAEASSSADEVREEVARELVRYVENAEEGTTATDAAADVVQRLHDVYGVTPHPTMTDAQKGA